MFSSICENFRDFSYEIGTAIKKQSIIFFPLVIQKGAEMVGYGNHYEKITNVFFGSLAIAHGVQNLVKNLSLQHTPCVAEKPICKALGKSVYEIGSGTILIAHTLFPSPVISLAMGINLMIGGVSGTVRGVKQVKEAYRPLSNHEVSKPMPGKKWAKVAGGIASVALGIFSLKAAHHYIQNGLSGIKSSNNSLDTSKKQLAEYSKYINRTVLHELEKEIRKIDPKVTPEVIARFLFANTEAIDRTHINQWVRLNPKKMAALFTLKDANGLPLFETLQGCYHQMGIYSLLENGPYKVLWPFSEKEDASINFDQLVKQLDFLYKNYPKSQIKAAYRIYYQTGQVLNLLNEKKAKDALILLPYKEDQAFSARWAPEETLSGSFNLYATKVRQINDICQALKDERIHTSKSFDALIISGHGQPNGIALEGQAFLDKNNMHNITQCIEQNLSKDAPIILNSCSTGKETADGHSSFAEQLSKETRRTIMAPTRDSATDECSIKIDKITHKIISYSCMRTNSFAAAFGGGALGEEYGKVFQPI